MPAKGYRKPKVECSIDSCADPVKARGWCGKHYLSWRVNGTPIPPIRGNYGSNRRETKNGYIAIYEPSHPLAMGDGYVLEHRKVAWDAGLFTDPRLQIHHKDEDKKNNSVENLEPKTASRHHADHVREQGFVVNQYGTWPLRS